MYPSPSASISATAIACSTTTASASIRTATTRSPRSRSAPASLDNRNMVCDFSDIKRIVKGWIDRELDHKMLLRHDDPLVAPLQQLGEPVYLLDSNPTVERIAQADLRQGARAGLAGHARHRLGNANLVRRVPRLALSVPSPSVDALSFRLIVFDLDGTLVDSLRDIADAANALLVSCGAAPISAGSDRRHGRRRCGDSSSRARSRRAASSGLPDALERYLACYDARAAESHAPVRGHSRGARRRSAGARRSRSSPTSRSPRRRRDSRRPRSRASLSAGRRARRRRAVCRESRIRRRCCSSQRALHATPCVHADGRRFRHRLADGARRRDARVSRAIRVRFRHRAASRIGTEGSM